MREIYKMKDEERSKGASEKIRNENRGELCSPELITPHPSRRSLDTFPTNGKALFWTDLLKCGRSKRRTKANEKK